MMFKRILSFIMIRSSCPEMMYIFLGHVALGTLVYPKGITGNCLDPFARSHLWAAGLDYKHGTGHGVGSYLNVHEGPMGISTRVIPDDPGFQVNVMQLILLLNYFKKMLLPLIIIHFKIYYLLVN